MAQTRTILVAEDNPDDAFLFRTAYTLGALEHTIHFVQDGEQVLQYLQGVPPFSDLKNFPEADLLVLDLKMPLMDGFEVIKWIRSRPAYAELPIVVFSGSNVAEDERRAIGLGANAYYVKPSLGAQLQLVVREICSAWFGHTEGA